MQGRLAPQTEHETRRLNVSGADIERPLALEDLVDGPRSSRRPASPPGVCCAGLGRSTERASRIAADLPRRDPANPRDDSPRLRARAARRARRTPAARPAVRGPGDDTARAAQHSEGTRRPRQGDSRCDESAATITKRFDAVGVESTAESRRGWRELLVTAAGAGRASAVSSCTTRRSASAPATARASPKRSSAKASRPASRSIRAPTRSPAARARRSPRASTGCASGCMLTTRSGRALRSGGP